MSISEQVGKLERENKMLRAGWQHDLNAYIQLAERHGDTKAAEAAKVCLKNI